MKFVLILLLAIMVVSCDSRRKSTHHPQQEIMVYVSGVARALAVGKLAAPNRSYPNELPDFGLKEGEGYVVIGNKRYRYVFSPRSEKMKLILIREDKPSVKYTIDGEMNIVQ